MTSDETPSLPSRKWLHHELPTWVISSPNYFVTLCCATRTTNQLCNEPIGTRLLESASHYQATGKWFVHILLLMPDHLHAILCLPSEGDLTRCMTDFKKYTSRRTGIAWQHGFFEHRLRSDESLTEKIQYIEMNPVRKGLVDTPDAWRWKLRPSSLS